MDNRLQPLYEIPDHVLPQDLYLLDLSEQCAALELRVRAIAQSLHPEQRQLLEAFLDLRDEMEYQSVKIAMKYGKFLK